MGKFRPRTKGKGNRWKKGQSSSSNPTVTKYRDKARSNFFQENSGGPSLLTTEALRKHDVFVGSKDPKSMEEDVDAITVGASTSKTCDTFATDFSGCTNMSYSKLLLKFNPDSAIQKERLAVLAAVTDVIKSNGGTENNTEYFAALMAMLENSECEEMSVAAVISILAMGIKQVPQPVLQQRFSQCSKIFVDLLAKYADSQNNIIFRGALGCLSVLLRNQDAHVWKDSYTVQVFHTVLMFTVYSKPKARKAAQHAVCSLLRISRIVANGNTIHPAAPLTAEFCIQQIENNGSLNSSTTTTLHVLGLLKDVLPTFPKKHMKAVCETILKVMTLGNIMMLSCGMQSLHGLFVSRPTAVTLTSELNAQLLTALYDYQPQSTDSQPIQAWLAVMQEGIINLSKSNLTLAITNLPRLLSTAVSLWLTGRSEIMNAATLTMRACLEDCLASAAEPEVVSNYQLQIEKIIALFKSTLGYKYHAVWSHVLHLFVSLFKVCGKTCAQMLLPCIKELVELRDSAVFTYTNEIDFCMGMAVRTMGPETILSVIPLQLIEDKKYEFKRSWLLPVLRENVKRSTLKCFIDYFLPLAVHCKNRSEHLKNANDQVQAISYDLLQTQIWALLPSFCSHPTDIVENFQKIAKVLGSILGTRKELKLTVMAALRKLITSTKETGLENELKELRRFAKNYLPILFNIYTTPTTGSEEEGIRLAAFETIKEYLTLADDALSLELFQKAMSKFSGEDVDVFIKESILDLFKALIPFQCVTTISKLYDDTISKLESVGNYKEEKKYYRILEEICKSENEGCVQFLDEKITHIRHLLLNSLSTSVPNSKIPRLLCLLHLLRRQQGEELVEFVAQIVPEAVMCCQEINSRCRTISFNLITEMAERMIECDQLNKYIEMILAGLGGSSRMVSATIFALASLTYQCKEQLSDDIVDLLLNSVLLLTCSSTREIVRATLSFVKLYITSFNRDDIAPKVRHLIKALVNMSGDCKRSFRIKTRDILDRLVRWFGANNILSMVPPSDTIMITRIRNLRKLQDRKKKLRNQALDEKKSTSNDIEFSVKKKPKSIDEILAESDSDLDIDDDDEPHKRDKHGKNKKSKSQAWIQEDLDEFVDFTASTANMKITMTKPDSKADDFTAKNKKTDKLSNRGFKTAPDGRLIIKDDYSDDDEHLAKNKKKLSLLELDSVYEDDDDEYDDIVTDTKSVASSKTFNNSRKRKMSVSSDVSAQPAMKYQAGGSGIHRPINKKPGTKTKKQFPGKISNDIGSAYRSEKARGDMKRKGMPNPYAYLPLERKLLNRRKKMKAAGQFKNIVSGAKKGAKMGRINKVRSSKK